MRVFELILNIVELMFYSSVIAYIVRGWKD